MIKITPFILFLVASISFVLPNYANAKDWHQSFKITGVSGSYSSNASKKSQLSGEIDYSRTYLEKYGYSGSLSYNTADFSDSTTSALEQYKLRGSAWWLFTPDHFPTNIVLSTDAYFIDNNDDVTNTGNVKVVSISSAFNALSGLYAITPSYSYSQYQNQLSVNQIDVDMGMAINNKWDWVSYKPSVISISDASVVGKNQYISHKLNWSHFISKPESYYNLASVSLSTSFGDKAFLVDTVSKGVYNLKDISQSSVALDFAFNLKKQQQVLAGVGLENFEQTASNTDYSLVFAYLQYVKKW